VVDRLAITSVKWAKLILAVCILAVPLSMAQARLPEENPATMSDLTQRGLRGTVKSCTETTTHPAVTDADGKTHQYHSEYTTEYDSNGRILVTRRRNSDGSHWVTRSDYDPTSRLLKTASGVEGGTITETTYSYDQQGRLLNITAGDKPDSPAVFRYDERGRKSKIEVSSPADYRSNIAFGGSPFEAADRAPNLPSGGSATTLYDDHDRATEVQVRDASGKLVSRVLRRYNAGHRREANSGQSSCSAKRPDSSSNLARASGGNIATIAVLIVSSLDLLFSVENSPSRMIYAAMIIVAMEFRVHAGLVPHELRNLGT
jgi:hypothetical protein